MVATEAFGLAVIDDQPTPSPITDRAGQPIVWHQTRTLTLADGSTAWGCAHCDYVSRNPKSIRPHLSKHNRRPATGTISDPAGELTVQQLLAQLAALEELRTDRDGWKVRALKAEKSLRTLRSVLRSDE